MLLILPYNVSAENSPRIIHAYIALCDNQSQGIVPVPDKLGNGDDPGNNLYWGAMYGIKTFFEGSSNWELLDTIQLLPPVIERCVFKHSRENVYFIADAYQGKEIKKALIDFLDAASGTSRCTILIKKENLEINIHGESNLLVYIGHDGLMDFSLNSYPAKQNDRIREIMILACFSKVYFRDAIVKAGAKPLLWTNGLMAPEAYTLENAIEGWVKQESGESIRLRAAKAYHKYQKCGLRAAQKLFATGL